MQEASHLVCVNGPHRTIEPAASEVRADSARGRGAAWGASALSSIDGRLIKMSKGRLWGRGLIGQISVGRAAAGRRGMERRKGAGGSYLLGAYEDEAT